MNQIIWAPKPDQVRASQMWAFRQNVVQDFDLPDETYLSLHQWSVEHIEEFWRRVAVDSEVSFHQESHSILSDKSMPGARWFDGAQLNFAEHLLKNNSDHIALVFANETGVVSRLTYRELHTEVGKIQQGLKECGVGVGDRVVGLVPNIPEAVIAMLATSALGAIWSSCSPDFGFSGVMDRFSQINPKVLIAADQVLYNGKWHSTLDKVKKIKESLTSLEKVVVVRYPHGPEQMIDDVLWDEFGSPQRASFESLDFNHPLYIMYSSGTTGVPKCIVHGAGGTLLAHLKEHRLHGDLRSSDVLFYFTTCGWMMWNWLVSGLSCGASVVLYDGSPLVSNGAILFDIASTLGITHFGCSPKYISSVMKEDDLDLNRFDFSWLKTIYSTGAPLLPEHFFWVYKNWKQDVQLASISGGTDIIGCFMLSNPMMPVRVGEIQAPGLGLDVQAYSEQGQAVLGEKGELVCRQPFPNMPIKFWNDEGMHKYRGAYFEKFPDVWWHGDFIEMTTSGGVVVYGRSDATLNPGGVRIGTAEIYRQVESVDWVKDSLVVGVPREGDVEICLYLVCDGELNDERKNMLKQKIRKETSPRHVPSFIFQVPDIPRTLSGKKVEKAVLNQVLGKEVTNRDALANPEALDAFTRFI